MLVQNKKLQKALIDIEKKRKKQYNAVVGDPPIPGPSSFPRVVDDERNSPDDTFDGKIPDSCFLDDYVEEDLREILGEQNNLINMLQEHGYSKHTANRLLIIYDDLVGSSLYNTSKNGIFKKSNTNHRHYSLSNLMVSQGYKEIQKTIRSNFTCLILFKIFNEKELEVIYEEYPVL